ncbi:MAG TPA: serine/threonine-protein kinase, partial [Nannocystaceae bacterium]|nr:serine/threonine-protein kinase [Nannocystaceae bacterium]
MTDSSQSDADDPAIAQLMARGRPATDLAELRALAGVKRGLFDQAPRPVLLSRYVLLERIGAGGLGVVFAAYDPSLDRRVAIKLLQARTIAADDAELARARLVREAQAIARLAHPNVVAVHDVGTYELEQSLDGVLPRGVFVVMEYIDGEDLDAWVRARPRHWSDVLAVYLAAGRGLAAAHRAGLVHRDFKPGNVLIARDAHGADALGRARVLDFGLVRAHGWADTPQRPDRDAPARAATLTRVGGVLGTPAYMAPEQHAGTAADARSDQYAFCVALWEALFGVRPFAGDDADALASAKLALELVPPPSSSRVPQAIVRALRRGLSPRPEQRFADMAALLDALAEVSRRRRRRLGVAIAVSLGGAFVAALALRPDAVPPCRDFAQLREAVWNDSARAELDASFAASQRPHAQASARAVTRALDAYVNEWDAARREVCESALVHARIGVEAMNRISLCLDRDLAQVAELVALLRTADDEAIDSAVDAVDALPPLSACTDAPTSAPDDELGEIARLLARADAMFEASHYDEASALAEAARRSAEREGRVGLRARAELVLGRVQLRRGDIEPGLAQLHAALASAERVGDESTAVEALLALGRHALDAARIVDAARLLELADAKLAHHRLGEALAFEAVYDQAILARLRG